ncbi:MAG: hypothetical protein D6736_17135 [Nitrospinota bacterium]|nr:MAG: hypothetical protein D6736_17135 [Nitrospinota bacterium]
MKGVTMALVFRDTTIITGDPARTILYNAALAVEGDRITAVGPSTEIMARYPQAEIFDGRGKALFPGLINCHAHMTATLHRGITEDTAFPSRLRFPVEIRSLLSDEETAIMATLAAIECIRTGNTTVLEIGSELIRYAAPLVQSGLRLFLAESANDGETAPGWRPGEPVHRFSPRLREEGLARMQHLLETWHGKEGGRIRCMPAATHTEANSPQMLQQVRALAERYDTGYTIHLGQSPLEVETMVRTRGVRPALYLFHHDFLGPRLIAGHCRYLDPAEISVLGTTRSCVSHQPAMAARRAVIPPIPALQAAGCTIAMGTDNNTQDMVQVLRIGLMLDRILRADPVFPQPEDVLEWTTQGGARVLALQDQIGSLEVGKKADLFVLDTRRPHLVPTMRIVSGFVHNGHPADIEAVMVDGRFLMRDRRVLTVDEAEIIARADEIGRRTWQRLRERYPGVPFPFTLAPL